MGHVTKLCGEEKNNPDLNCLFPGNDRLQEWMDQKIKGVWGGGGCAWEQIGCRVNRWFTKCSCSDHSLSTPCSPKASRQSPHQLGVKTEWKGEDRTAKASQSNPLPRWKENFANFIPSKCVYWNSIYLQTYVKVKNTTSSQCSCLSSWKRLYILRLLLTCEP